jgi:hypothetical protein
MLSGPFRHGKAAAAATDGNQVEICAHCALLTDQWFECCPTSRAEPDSGSARIPVD